MHFTTSRKDVKPALIKAAMKETSGSASAMCLKLISEGLKRRKLLDVVIKRKEAVG